MDDDGDDKDDTKRRTRNLSEKKRRDQFNMLVNDLSSMVSTNGRKMDKSTVLKSTILYLKNHNDTTSRSRVHDIDEDWKPACLSNDEFTYLVLDSLEGFLIVFSATGCIYYVSDSVKSLLGHNPSDLLSQSIFDVIHEEDRRELYTMLQSVSTAQFGDSNSDGLKFHLHMRRGRLDFKDNTTYELVQFNGYFRSNMNENNFDEIPTAEQDQKSKLVIVCTGRLQTPHFMRDVSLVDSSRNEFTSRHSLEWKFLFLDHRASAIIGYLPFEVLGTSGYDYYHFDDLEKVVSGHEDLMQKGELTSCYYRFLTKGQQWIWLQSRYYITYHQWNAKPEFVVCTHRVVSSSEVKNDLKREAEKGSKNRKNSATMTFQEAPTSPSSPSESSDLYGGSSSYMTSSKAPSVNSASASSTTGTAITAPMMNFSLFQSYGTVSDTTGSVSGDDNTDLRNCNIQFCHAEQIMTIIPHHVIGTQYLEPVPFVRTVNVIPARVIPVSVKATADQAEEELQRKHEELQQMILKQQAELRNVKKQLVLARLGIMPSIVDGPYIIDDGLQQTQLVSPQIMYETMQPIESLTDFNHPPHPNMPQ